MSVRILQGDCRQVLRTLPDESVHCVVTSPPYFGLRDYQVGGQIGLEPTPDEFVDALVQVFREVRRVLRSDGTVWLNLGDSYANDAHGPRGAAKSTLTGNGAYQAEATPPGMQKGWRASSADLKKKDLLGIPWMVAFALRADGWWLRDCIIWHKPNPMPESVRDRTTKAHEYVFLLAKSERYFYDTAAIAEPVSPVSIARIEQASFDQQEGGQKDYIHGTNPNRSMRKTLENFAGRVKRSGNKARKSALERGCPEDGVDGSVPWEGVTRNKRSVWTVSTKPFNGAHFAVFPPDLVDPCVLAGTSAHGCCSSCGAPWERQVEREFIPQQDVSTENGIRAAGEQKPMDASNTWQGEPRGTTAVATVGWRPTCVCGAPAGIRLGDQETVESPTYDDAGERSDLYEDPSLEVGRAGMARPRKPGEGVRPMTRYEQRQYAEQLRQAEAEVRALMRDQAGDEAFAHYLRTDRTGARPIPPALLADWLARGWLAPAQPLPAWDAPPVVPCTVLDPFGGAGTTGLVADRHHRNAVLIELNKDYAELARRRLLADAPLFTQVHPA